MRKITTFIIFTLKESGKIEFIHLVSLRCSRIALEKAANETKESADMPYSKTNSVNAKTGKSANNKIGKENTDYPTAKCAAENTNERGKEQDCHNNNSSPDSLKKFTNH